jgi:hypothetical protein
MTTKGWQRDRDRRWQPGAHRAGRDLFNQVYGVWSKLPLRPRPKLLGGWRQLTRHDRTEALRALQPWAVAHLDDLVSPEEQAEPAIAGRTLLHGDLYPFNLLLTRQPVFVVDWLHA